jgi:uncharacterized protein YndB with AHSA1/START domain
MNKLQYVYVTYILTTPEKVWAALTDAELTAQYWERSNVSDWKVGSKWSHGFRGKEPDVVGEVLEADPPRRLVTSWSPASKVGDPARRSRVTYDIQTLGEKVRLTVTHTDLTEEGLRDISQGWPAVLSNLKTFLETGRTIPDPFSGIHQPKPEAVSS